MITDYGIPIIAENSDSLSTLNVNNPYTDFELKNEFFNSIGNAHNLENLAIKSLHKLQVTSLSDYLKDELPSITNLNLGTSNSTLKDLKGLELFTGLKTFKMNYTSANLDISAIKNCPTLETVDLGYCKINSLNGIEGLTNLKTLTISNNNITSLKPLENLKNLTSLNLQNNAISDTSSYIDTDGSTKTYRNLDILAGLHTSNGGNLTSLYLSGNGNIIDFSPVSSLNWTNKSGF